MLSGVRPVGAPLALGVISLSLRSSVLEWHRAYPMRVSLAQLTSWLCLVGSVVESDRSGAADTLDGTATAAVMTATLAAAAVSARRMLCTPVPLRIEPSPQSRRARPPNAIGRMGHFSRSSPPFPPKCPVHGAPSVHWVLGRRRMARMRTTGRPTSSNRASSFHLHWKMPTAEKFTEVSVTIEVLVPPAVPELYFWALQAGFSGGGAAHTGLQWFPEGSGRPAVNWGGY